MGFTDRTPEFKRTLSEKEKAVPDSKRRKLNNKPTASKDAAAGQEYLREAYTILNHIGTLTRMLASIRRAYLNVDARTTGPSSRLGPRAIDLDGGESAWSNVKHLSNEERDQIDIQARTILQQCSSRVKEMEVLEKRALILYSSLFFTQNRFPCLGRAELVASKVNPLVRLLPARLRQDESSVTSDVIAAHRSSVTWYLNRRLMEASQIQKDLQEERVKRQLERTKTLASGASKESAWMDSHTTANTQGTSNTSWLGDASSGFLAATLGTSSPEYRHAPQPLQPDSSFTSEDEDDDLELTSSQILQFEAENAALLQNVQDTLESVQQAESRLADISALQMELVTHLTRQAELTDQLYDDAIATTLTVEKSKAELKKAQQRGKDGRLFLLVFLIGASFSLLFLHYY
ncbi:hypothetical protein BKA70DRAFT_1419955 [Coprinopsis sp. MPI-PUGE-AT-0042]|nr:hypothetical protein BKA70DRAFT_1419955 [Coprinopsis sp. MPI-PUGE-AT-0042]